MFKTLIIVAFSLLWAVPPTISQSLNDSVEIRAMLDERDAEVKELLGPSGTEYTQEQRDEIKDMINGIIHYRSLAQFALGSTYDEISVENREEFVTLFSTIIRDNSLNSLEIYRADVTYTNIEIDNDQAMVATTAELEDVRTSVDYQMRNIDGNWMITDITIDSVSTAESYNRQFQSIIRQRGFDALLQSLRRRAARASSQQN
jgi:phospholipid transport system substrate-binding protein